MVKINVDTKSELDYHEIGIVIMRGGKMAAVIRSKNILGGTPRISGTRISVNVIGSFISSGYGIKEIKKSYPHLSNEQIDAALEYLENKSSKEREKLESRNS